MDFLRILKSLEEFLYEAMTWLVFYPRTMWRVVRRPAAMMDYARAELHDDVEEQYKETISPPLFLVLTLMLSHGLELALVGQDRLVGDHSGLSALISSDAALIVYRALSFSVFPLAMAAQLLRRQGRPIDRDTLRGPFFSQCYVTAPFALMFGLVSLLPVQASGRAAMAAAAAVVVAVPWYLTLQTRWFVNHARLTLPRATLAALFAYGLAVAILAVAGLFFV